MSQNRTTEILEYFAERDEDNNIIGASVYIQDQMSDIIDYLLCIDLSELTLAIPTVIDTYTITVTDASSVIAGTYICLQETDRAFQAKILSKSGNDLTLDTPMDFVFSTDAYTYNRSPELAVDGSVTPVVASLAPIPGVKWDVVRIIGSMLSPFADGAPSDSKFAGISPLTRGIVLRKSNGVHHTIFNAKTNGEIKLRTGPTDVVYTTASANVSYGTGFRRTFNGQEKNGVVIRLDGDKGDRLDILIQDDLTGLTSFKVVAQGHVVEDYDV